MKRETAIRRGLGFRRRVVWALAGWGAGVAAMGGWGASVGRGAEEARLGWSFDTGLTPAEARKLLGGEAGPRPPAGSWLRVRSGDFSGLTPDELAGATEAKRAEIAATRQDLAALRAAGYRLVMLLRWPQQTWVRGVRRDREGHRLALDLREAFARCRGLVHAYGDLIAYWEIDNEPDLSFVQENPETYTAFLKACYLGAQRGREERGPGVKDESRVVMAALGLPPGPYFAALARNDGLRYTDGFNYHYYGYAEDFSGMYRRSEEAVAEAQREHARSWPVEAPPGTAVFRTRFFPSADGWRGSVRAEIGPESRGGAANAVVVTSRPRAAEEPGLHPVGRWWVTDGTTVEEIPGGWRFRVEQGPAGPWRAPVAELALPADWRMEPDSLLSFQYRLIPETPLHSASDVAPRPAPAKPARPAVTPSPPAAAETAVAPRSAGRWPERSLPILITEYGYPSLDRFSRQTEEGRERQRRYFESVASQIQALGIEAAMAFVLVAGGLEWDMVDWGLLMNDASAPPGAVDAARPEEKWGAYVASPAFRALQAAGAQPYRARRWPVQLPPAAPVVIDFVAGEGLGMAKSYSGYFLEGEHGRAVPGKGELIVYHFGAEPVSGRLELDGDAWALVGGGKTLTLNLAPGERRQIAVEVRPTVTRFVASPVTAWFKPEIPAPVAAKASTPAAVPAAGATEAVGGTAVAVAETRAAPPRRVAPTPPPGAPVHLFEPYFRTANGNLYEAGPRLLPLEKWQVYFQARENFTPAFFGRLEAPGRIEQEEPVSLVLHFHPAAFPAVFEVQYPRMLTFAAPERE